MSDVGFVHLRVHSAFSLLEGALPLGRLIDLARADDQPAIAITDTANLFGALEFSEKAWGAGVQPIVGVQIPVDFQDGGVKKGRETVHLSDVVLLAADQSGYANLMDIVSRAYLDTDPSVQSHVTAQRLVEHAQGVILLTGGVAGPVGQALVAGDAALARTRLETLKAGFADRLYVEVQRHDMPEEIATEADMVALAYELDLPLVATNVKHAPILPQFAGASDDPDAAFTAEVEELRRQAKEGLSGIIEEDYG
jgi:DNA polymerase-3 subunit alpha